MVGQSVQQGTGKLLRAEDLGPLRELEVRGQDQGLPFIAVGNDLEEQLGSGF